MNIKKFISFVVILFSISNIAIANQDNKSNIDEEKLLREYVLKLIDDSYSLFNNKTMPEAEKDKQVASLLERNLYLDWMARYSIGRHRRTLSKEKLDEFIEVYKKFIIKAYVSFSKNYASQKVTLKKVKQLDDDLFIVNIDFSQPGGGAPIKVDYLVHELEDVDGKSFKVGDVVTEGVSIINAQQSEFNSVITNRGIDALIADLKAKIDAK